jgi:hypothetical protein
VVTVPTKPTTTTTTTPADQGDTVAPTDGDAPAVCAAAATTPCGPTDPAPAADNSFDARVQRCQAWWNDLADRLDANGRPEWAARAREVAGRCEAMIARWQQWQDRWEQRQAEKGDHNGDGHADNGNRFRRDGRADRPSPQPKQSSRHSEGRH